MKNAKNSMMFFRMTNSDEKEINMLDTKKYILFVEHVKSYAASTV